jgi:hypothetical protein
MPQRVRDSVQAIGHLGEFSQLGAACGASDEVRSRLPKLRR